MLVTSHKPLKFGTRSGMNFHEMFWEEQNWDTATCVFSSSRNSKNAFISQAAQTKFIPWSLQMRDGLPRQAMKCRSVATKASVVKSDTASR